MQHKVSICKLQISGIQACQRSLDFHKLAAFNAFPLQRKPIIPLARTQVGSEKKINMLLAGIAGKCFFGNLLVVLVIRNKTIAREDAHS